MAASNAVSAFAIKVGYGASPTWVAEIVKVTGPKYARDAIDVTNHDSTGGAKEFIASGVYDADGVSFDFHLIAGAGNNRALVHAKFLAATVEDWTIRFPDLSKVVATGFITELSFGDYEVDGAQVGSMTIKFTGVPVLSEAP